MARTTKSIILSTLNAYADRWVSPGELYASAQDERKYTGTQERLLQKADELARQGVIESKPRGRMQNNWYRPVQHQTEPAREFTYHKGIETEVIAQKPIDLSGAEMHHITSQLAEHRKCRNKPFTLYSFSKK